MDRRRDTVDKLSILFTCIGREGFLCSIVFARQGPTFQNGFCRKCSAERQRIRFDGFKNNLIMLRYDGEVWLENS